MKNKRFNIWKLLFLILLACNLALVCVATYRILTPQEQVVHRKNQDDSHDVKAGSFITNRDELNNMVSSVLKKYQSKKLTYQFYATSNDVMFQGTYKLLGANIPLYVYFKPHVLNNGNLQLEITNVSAGTLSLPKKEILSYITSTYKLPQFIIIKPNKSQVLVTLKDLEFADGLYAKAEEFDLTTNNIRFDLYKKQ